MHSTRFAIALTGFAMLVPAIAADPKPTVIATAAGAVAIAGDPQLTPGTSAPGTSTHVTFDRYSPIATVDEITRRTSTPIGADNALGSLQGRAQHVPEQGIHLADEKFWIYVPNGGPPKDGYGVFVFIPPWDEGTVPSEWRKVFDKHGLIYVAADRSGNDEHMLWRRFPLALHAYENVAARFHVDPTRVYVSGFSGGSRTAMRMALTYPDVFRGAVLNSGADPFGVPGISVPPAELFHLFQQRSRLIAVSGTEDIDINARDAAMLDSAARLCVQGTDTQPMLHTGHALMRGFMLDHAIASIERPDTDPSRHADVLARCRAGIDAEIARGLDDVRALMAQGKTGQAGQALLKIDERFGGLAAPASVELARKFPARK